MYDAIVYCEVQIGDTPLIWAASRGDAATAELLLSRGASANLASNWVCKKIWPHNGSSFCGCVGRWMQLSNAVSIAGSPSCITISVLTIVLYRLYTIDGLLWGECLCLVKTSVHIPKADHWLRVYEPVGEQSGRSPLSHAAACGNVALVQLLLQHGADATIPDRVCIILHGNYAIWIWNIYVDFISCSGVLLFNLFLCRSPAGYYHSLYEQLFVGF